MRAPQSPYAIPLREIPADGLHRAYDLTGAFAEVAFEGTEVDTARSSVAAELDLFRTGHEVVVRGTVSGDLVAICSRCAGEAHVTLASPLDVVFVPRGTELPETEEDEIGDVPDVVQYDDETIDLAETLREELLLALPIAPLCREDCRGLCPRCGHDLNEGACACPEVPRDDRWSGLKNLKLD